MKRLFYIILFSFVLFCLIGVTSIAGSTVEVSLEDTTAKPGDVIDVPLKITGNTGFSNLSLEIDYDPAYLQLLGVTPATSVGASFTTAPNFTSKPYNMQWDSANNITYNGTLAVLSFRVVGDTGGNTVITLDYYKGRNGDNVPGDDINYDADYKPVSVAYQNGTVTVTGGSVTPPQPVSACVTVLGSTVKAGETASVSVVLSGNTGFSNLSIEINYDSAALTLVGVTPATDVGASFTTAPNLTAKPYNMQWDSAGNSTFNGTLAVLNFKVNDDACGVYPVTVDYYKGRNGDNVPGEDINYTEEYAPLSLTYTGGEINVQSASQEKDWKYTKNASVFTVTDAPEEGQIAAVYYTSGGKMISFGKISLNVSTAIPSGTAKIKLILLNDLFVPQCKAGDVK